MVPWTTPRRTDGATVPCATVRRPGATTTPCIGSFGGFARLPSAMIRNLFRRFVAPLALQSFIRRWRVASQDDFWRRQIHEFGGLADLGSLFFYCQSFRSNVLGFEVVGQLFQYVGAASGSSIFWVFDVAGVLTEAFSDQLLRASPRLDLLHQRFGKR